MPLILMLCFMLRRHFSFRHLRYAATAAYYIFVHIAIILRH